MDAVAFERRVTILAVLWRVRPAISLERARHAAQILGPDRDVQVVVGTGDVSRVEIDGPAAEQPVLEAFLLEELV
ncbi:MAG TPA: hypothetical protein VGJ49_05550 [Gaiellaceae bacterium]